MSDSVAPKPRDHWFNLSSPIGVIGAFASVTELALILGVIFAEGNLRWGLLILAPIFFFGVVAPFFYVLINMNWKLYPPKEFGEGGAAPYVEAMQIARAKMEQNEEVIRTSVREYVTSPEFAEMIAVPADHEGDIDRATQQIFETSTIQRRMESIASRVADEVVEQVRENSTINIGTGWLTPGAPTIFTIQYEPQERFSDVLMELLAGVDSVNGARLDDSKRLLHYGQTWTLRDVGSGKLFPSFRYPTTAKRMLGERLSDIGITAGMHLVVVGPHEVSDEEA